MLTTNDIFLALYQRYQTSFISVGNSASELTLHPATARAWISQNRFPLETTLIGGKRLVSIAKLSIYLAQQAGIDHEPALKPPEKLLDKVVDLVRNQIEIEPATEKRKPGRPRKALAVSNVVGVCRRLAEVV